MANGSVINFGKFETASVLANVFIIKIFLGLPGELARAAGTAGWIVSLISGLLFLIILFFIFKIFSSGEEQEIIALSQKTLGRGFSVVFGVVLFVSFLVKGALALRVTTDIIVTILPFDLPHNACYLLFTLAALFCAFKGIEGVVRVHAVFLPLILAAFLFAAVMSLVDMDITNIYPILGFGYKNIGQSSLKYIGIYSDIIYIFLLAPYVKNKKIYKKACFGGVIISALVITGVIFFYTLAVPYPESTKLFMPIYQVSRIAKIGANSQGFEAFLLPEWIISSLLYVSLSVFFAHDMLRKVFKPKRDKIFIIPSAAIVYILAFLPKSLQQASDFGLKYVNIFVIAVSAAAVLISFIAKLRRKV